MLSEVVQPLTSRCWEMKSVDFRIFASCIRLLLIHLSRSLCDSDTNSLYLRYCLLSVSFIMSKSPWSSLYMLFCFVTCRYKRTFQTQPRRWLGDQFHVFVIQTYTPPELARVLSESPLPQYRHFMGNAWGAKFTQILPHFPLALLRQAEFRLHCSSRLFHTSLLPHTTGTQIESKSSIQCHRIVLLSVAMIRSRYSVCRSSLHRAGNTTKRRPASRRHTHLRIGAGAT